MRKLLLKLIFLFISFAIVLLIILNIFNPLFKANSLVFPYAVHPFDIVSTYPKTWILLKKFYFVSSFISFFILFNKLFNILYSIFPNIELKTSFNKEKNPKELSLFVGLKDTTPVYISEKGLYQNILITGTIGTGKTSSAMYPFTKQLIEYLANNPNEKSGMLILDVKGNYFEQVVEFAINCGREKDIISIDLSGNLHYNPLDKPELSPIVLANRLKTILTLFSPNNSESYWLDKVEQILTEAIKFCRLYNDGYVSFLEIHKLIMFPEYYSEKLSIAKNLFLSKKYTEKEVYNLLTCIDFFEKEFFSLDQRTISILKSEISRITNIFVSDFSVSKTFCPPRSLINFHGFKETLEKRQNCYFKYEYI